MVVIAISGASGSGKTSTIKQLSKKLNCPYLLFDDYVNQNTYPKEMKCWFELGADVCAIQTPCFIQAIQKAKSATDSPYLFIEEPLGRERALISPLIDYVVLLEVCLSRVITRHILHPKTEPLVSIPKYLSMYDDYFRDIYIEVNNKVRVNCDSVINEITTSELLAETIRQWLDVNVPGTLRNFATENKLNTKMEL